MAVIVKRIPLANGKEIIIGEQQDLQENEYSGKNLILLFPLKSEEKIVAFRLLKYPENNFSGFNPVQ